MCQMLYQVTDYIGCILEINSYSEMGNSISCTKKAVRWLVSINYISTCIFKYV